jgi:hypothetical protein
LISLPPWANGPFELLVHAEGHLRGGDDFDRRIALISFDNAIEVAITTYLTLNPIQRAGRSYSKTDVEKWLDNYHSKLDFLYQEVAARKLPCEFERGHIIWVHDCRNVQYHGGQKGTPERNVLALVRRIALWIFALLFDVMNVEQHLGQAIAEKVPPSPAQRDAKLDRAIDREYPMLDVGEETYYVSELLFAVDYAAYLDIGARLCASNEGVELEGAEE